MVQKKKRDKNTHSLLRVTIDEGGIVQSVSRVPGGGVRADEGFVTCSKCGKHIHRDDLRQHHRNVHRSGASTDDDSFSFLYKSTKSISAEKKKTDKPQTLTHRPISLSLPIGRPKTICPQCGAIVLDKNLQKHIQKVHYVSTVPLDTTSVTVKKLPTVNETLVKCPICQVNVRIDRLEKHKGKVHGSTSLRSQATSSNRKRLDHNRSAKPENAKRRSGSVSSRIRDSEKLKLESLKQSLDEPRDGSKYWGHMRREHGRFGSHPLIDNYGDESEP